MINISCKSKDKNEGCNLWLQLYYYIKQATKQVSGPRARSMAQFASVQLHCSLSGARASKGYGEQQG